MTAQNWLGDIPTWITSLTVIIGLLALLGEKRQRDQNRDRESKQQATGLSAWPVKAFIDGNEDTYGAIIENSSGSTFHDVEIAVTLLDRETRLPIKLVTLPPGRYFLEHNPSQGFVWEFARETVEFENANFRPITKTRKSAVTSLTFSDNLGQRWHADHHAVLTKL